MLFAHSWAEQAMAVNHLGCQQTRLNQIYHLQTYVYLGLYHHLPKASYHIPKLKQSFSLRLSGMSFQLDSSVVES